jgi:hypothetical protein
MMCYIADAVLAGGIRRAALICLFNIDDEEMLTCKFNNWWELNPQRARANNSAVIVRNKVTEKDFKNLWEKIKASGSGEPGFYFTEDEDWGTNPCCFTGDTLVAVADGRNAVPIKELVDTVYPVYSVDADGKTVIKQSIKTWKSKENTEIWKVTLDDGSSFRATPDHRIMLRNGEYKELKDLISGDSLMPFNSYLSNKNHKVISVEMLAEREDVYDMTVEDTHNFGIITSHQDDKFITSSGVFVHNCEIALRPYEFCNLVEINADNIESQEDYEARAKAGAFISTLQAGYTDFHYIREVWKKTTEKDALIGVSMTGIASGAVLGLDETAAAKVVLEENARVAALIGVNPAARTTCIKPAGTTSCVLGSSSGIHAWHDEYFIRRMRIGKNESIYKYLSVKHPELVEDEFFKPHLEAVISLPMEASKTAILRNESALDLLERVKRFSKNWVKVGHREGANTHNVSATISVKTDEWDEVAEWMWENKAHFNGLSVLPFSDHAYVQAPFESCSKETYERMLCLLKEIDLTNIVEYEDATNLSGEAACAGGSCEIR